MITLPAPAFDAELAETEPRVDARVEPRSSSHATSRSLDRSLAHGVAWTSAAKLVGQVASWSSTIVVARLLAPSDYAIVGMATWLVGLLTLLTEFGLGAAIVAKQRTDDAELRELNAFAVLAGVATTLALCVAAPLVAMFFHDARLTSVVRALACGFTIAAFRVVPLAVMQRDLRFRAVARFDGLQSLALATLSVLLAWRGFGYWTLVAANLASGALTSTLAMVRYRVGFAAPTRERLRATLRFSADVVAQRVCWYAYSNADFAVAGRMLSTALTGSYTLAWGLAHIVVDKIAAIVLQVTPGILARAQNDPALLRRYFLRIVGGLATVCLPLMIGVSLVAPELVALALGPKWALAVTPLRVLAAYSSIWVMLGLAGQMLLVTGLERFGTRLTFAQMLVLPGAFFIGARLGGINGIAYAWVIVHPVFALTMVSRVLRAIGLRWRELLRDALIAPVTATAVMALAVTGVRVSAAGAHVSLPLTLVVSVVVGAASYTTTLEVGFRQYLATRIAALKEMRRDLAATV